MTVLLETRVPDPRQLILADPLIPHAISSCSVLRAMGIRDKPIAAGSPWQNSFAERLIGTIRRECVLDQDAPVSRPVQQIGRIVSHALVGGLHHQYVRI
jgi:Integrase core domain